MEFFNQGITALQILVFDLDVGLGIWGTIYLPESYGNDNRFSKTFGRIETDVVFLQINLRNPPYENILQNQRFSYIIITL